MPQLNKPLESYEKPGIVIRYRIASNTKIYKGALVGLNAAGWVVPMDPEVANLKFAGIAGETIANPVDGRLSVTLSKSGTFVLPGSGNELQSHVGSTAYATGDGTVSYANTGLDHAYSVGTIVGLETAANGESGVRIRIDQFTK